MLGGCAVNLRSFLDNDRNLRVLARVIWISYLALWGWVLWKVLA